MELTVRNTKIIIDFSFILMLCFVVISGYSNVFSVVIFSFFHESGHLLALLICKKSPERVRLSFLGLSLSYTNNLSIKEDAFVLLSGPLVNLLFYLITKDQVNLVLFFLNMLPIFPLDGGRLLSLFLTHKKLKIISWITLVLVIVLALVLLIKYKAFSLFLITIYLIAFNMRYL